MEDCLTLGIETSRGKDLIWFQHVNKGLKNSDISVVRAVGKGCYMLLVGNVTGTGFLKGNSTICEKRL